MILDSGLKYWRRRILTKMEKQWKKSTFALGVLALLSVYMLYMLVFRNTKHQLYKSSVVNLQPWDAEAYSKGRPVIPIKVMEEVMKYMGRGGNQKKKGIAVDVGSGSGQGTVIISKYFSSVYGVDNNAGQIEAANGKKHPDNVSYKVSSGEVLDFPDESVDLVICCTSYHWMNQSVFLPEVRRVLRPGGALAVMAIEHPEHPIHLPQPISSKLIQLQDNFFSLVIPYFAPQVSAYLEKYKSFFPLPGFRDSEYYPSLTQEWRTDLSTQIENLASSSAFTNLREAKPEVANKALEDVTEGFKKAMGGGEGALKKHVTFLVNAFMIIGKK